jgi:hypothetical protein
MSDIIATASNAASAYGAKDIYAISGIDDLKTLLEFEYNSVNYIYDLPPQQHNLFWAGNFTGTVDSKEANKFDTAPFRIQSVKWELPKLNFETNKNMKIDVISGVEIPHEVTITWLDDVYHTVQMFHINWFNYWYNREADCFVSGIKGKFKKLNIVSFHYKNAVSNSLSSVSQSGQPAEMPIPEIICVYMLRGLAPKSLAPISFSYSDTGNEELVSYNYSVVRTGIMCNQLFVDGIANEQDKKLATILFKDSVYLTSDTKVGILT